MFIIQVAILFKSIIWNLLIASLVYAAQKGALICDFTVIVGENCNFNDIGCGIVNIIQYLVHVSLWLSGEHTWPLIPSKLPSGRLCYSWATQAWWRKPPQDKFRILISCNKIMGHKHQLIVMKNGSQTMDVFLVIFHILWLANKPEKNQVQGYTAGFRWNYCLPWKVM